MPKNALITSIASRQSGLVTLLTGALLAPAAFAVNTTWDGSESNDWLEPLNWDTGNTPTAADNTFVQSGSISLSGDADTRFLRMGTTGTGTANLTLESGTLVSGGAGQAVLASEDGVTVNFTQNGGVFDVNHDLNMGGVGSGGGGASTYTLNGGTLSIESTGRSLNMGESSGASTTSTFIQNGGSVLIDSALHLGTERYGGGSLNVNTATYQIRGGILTTTNLNFGLASTGGNGMIDATTHVIGSDAAITVNGNILMNQNSNNDATMRFDIDNGGVSTINVAAGGSATLAGTLEAGVDNTVALTSANTFNLIEADTGAITNGFSNLPNAALWDVAINDIGGGRDALQLGLAASAEQASLVENEGASFAATTTGYVELNGLNAGSQEILLDFDAGTGMTIGEYVTYLTSNGIVASEILGGDYSVSITSEVESGTGYFTWDLGDFNSDATIAGVYFVPEPSVSVILMGLGALGLAGIVRRKRS